MYNKLTRRFRHDDLFWGRFAITICRCARAATGKFGGNAAMDPKTFPIIFFDQKFQRTALNIFHFIFFTHSVYMYTWWVKNGLFFRVRNSRRSICSHVTNYSVFLSRVRLVYRISLYLNILCAISM